MIQFQALVGGQITLSPVMFWPVQGISVSTAETSSGTLLIKAYRYHVSLENTADPLHPEPLGSVLLNGPVESLRVDGNILFAGTGIGVEMVDISDPRHPRRLASLSSPSQFQSVSRPGLVAVATSHLWVYDISEPLISRPLYGRELPAIPQTVHLFQGRAFFAASNYVWSADVFNPDAAGIYREVSQSWVSTVFEGNHAYAGVQNSEPEGDARIRLHAFELRTDGGVIDLGDAGFPLIMDRLWPLGDGSRRFLATGSMPGIHVVDLSNPAAPVLVDSYIPVSGNIRFVHGLGSHVRLAGQLGDELLFKRTDGRLEPVVFNRLTLAATGLDRTENRLAVAEPPSGLLLFDLSRTNEIVPLGSVALPGARDVRMNDSFAYVLRDEGLTVVDIRQPGSPIVLTNLPLASPVQIWLESTRIYIRNSQNSMRVFDVVRPEAPVEMGQVSLGDISLATVAAGYVFTGHIPGTVEQPGMDVIDLRNPAVPLNMPRLFQAESVLALETAGSRVRAVLGDGTGNPARFVIIDAATRTELSRAVLETLWPIEHRIRSIGSIAVLTAQNWRPQYVGITNGETAVFLGAWPGERPEELLTSFENDVIQLQSFPDVRLQRARIEEREYREVNVRWDGEITLARSPIELRTTLPSGSGETLELISGPGRLDGWSLTVTNTGLFLFRLSVPGNTQYRPELKFVTLSATRTPQSITFTPPATIPSFSPTLALAGSTSASLPLRYVVTRGPGLINGNRLTITNGTGPVTVYAIQDGDEIYEPVISQPKTVELFDPVQITMQPRPAWVRPGQPFSLSVGFTGGEPISVQWYRNSVTQQGRTGPTFDIPSATTNHTGLYHVVVGNRAGSVTSHWVTVGVGTPATGVTFIPRGKVPFKTGPLAYQAPGRVRILGNIAAVVSKGVRDLHLFDISDPDNPALLSKIDTTYDNPEDVGLLGDHAYVAIRNSGIRIIDISNPRQPVAVRTFPMATNRSDVVTMTIRGELAYVANGAHGLYILDLQNRTNPVMRGRLVLNGISTSVHLDGNKAYVPSWSSASGSDGGVHIVDVSNPANPTLIRRLRDGGYSYDCVLSDGFLQVADYIAGLKTWDPENATLTVPVNRVPNGLWNLARSGRLLFAANDSNGRYLSLFDLSNPSRPVNLGITAAADALGGVTYQNGRLYLVGKNFSIVDVLETSMGPVLTTARLGDLLRLSWPASATNYSPEAANGLGGNSPWQPVAVPVVTEGTNNRVDLPVDRTSRVFRLRRTGE